MKYKSLEEVKKAIEEKTRKLDKDVSPKEKYEELNAFVEEIAKEGYIDFKRSTRSMPGVAEASEYVLSPGRLLKEIAVEEFKKNMVKYTPPGPPIGIERAMNRAALGHHLLQSDVPEHIVLALMHHPDQAVQKEIDKWAADLKDALKGGWKPSYAKQEESTVIFIGRD